ncbi:hypothetical protein SAMN05421803_1519 [Nocardiopsis flavescens]|uniref:Uncharacterized protein n=1 Tax=Nocardiopsis flavescens TaxID=758803 RepID=A0A1M6WUU4_9ACTN|nr:hypothetical protein SAMN05421803_1519 [Nocardiopsis flavescens]
MTGSRARTGRLRAARGRCEPLAPVPGLRTFPCAWCPGTTGELPEGTPPAERICDGCVQGRLDTR